MARGEAKRLRKKRAERANFSNLFKASFGKASAVAQLPTAPKETDLQDKVPASLRRLMALKESAKKEDAKREARKNQAQQQQQQQDGRQAQHQQQTHHQQQQQQEHRKVGPSQQQGSRQALHNPAQEPTAEQPQAAATEQEPTKKQKKQAAPGIEERLYKVGAFDKSAKKKLKDSKKQFLERKKQRKKGGKGGDADLATPAEMKLKLQQVESQARFGEVADAPLKVQLKRKHWVKGPQEEGAPATTSHENSQRMKKIFLQQLATAQNGMSGQGSRPNKKQKTHSGGSPAHVGLLQQARERARVEAQQKAKAQLREEVVEAYRKSKKQTAVGSANLSSLARLVSRGSAAAAATAAVIR